MGIEKDAKRLKDELHRLNETAVRIALFGQPGAGKSSLINELTGQPLAAVGVHTDTTVEAATYEWNKLSLVDLPGYDTARFPKAKYFSQFDVPSFDLFLCVFEGKLHETDEHFFKELRTQGKVCLFVRNKCDAIFQKDKSYDQLCSDITADLRKRTEDESRQVFFTSTSHGKGISELELAIYANLDAAKRERWVRSAKAASKEFLDLKRSACEKHVAIAAGLSAANALNPIPGVDVAVDIGILLTLFKDLRDSYGLSPNRLAELAAGPLEAIAREVAEFATRQGILTLLKRFAGREAVKQVSKYIPFVGQAIAAAIGFGVTSLAGKWYLDHCHELAAQVLASELGKGQ